MQSNISSIISALKIIKKENPDSGAIELLEDALKKSMKYHVLDMASMGSVIDIKEVEEELRNGLSLLGIVNSK
ncbi:hypothetical protein [Flavivirga jejuensis]|uniref:Uncharacterized protein n=1 Tax=Flavivirga jejuensis TaxID=870487 RepID=A0ABT8WQH2_9FLAO|nr:hypothetical protein [Flavivirga jejuensis]MDO5975381.1 hypothetical protein [Flavivirga jejuensis]